MSAPQPPSLAEARLWLITFDQLLADHGRLTAHQMRAEAWSVLRAHRRHRHILPARHYPGDAA